ncbi:MAG TPA: GNAT family N-acetyltransferase [Gemmatimonadales bacterium]|nr:GNAT family N-acetyltransferase [Gemmatimonadales bacterium]
MLPPLSLQTPRLALRPFAAADFEIFYATCVLDPTVMAFYHAYRARLTDTERRARAKRDFLDHFTQGHASYDYVCWALTSGPALPPPVGTFVGWCGLLTPALDHGRWGPELAYMLARRWHGLGLATEAGAGVLADAWLRYQLPRLHAVVDSPNLASRRVLERLGFQLQGPVEVYGDSDMMLYTIAAPTGVA